MMLDQVGDYLSRGYSRIISQQQNAYPGLKHKYEQNDNRCIREGLLSLLGIAGHDNPLESG